MAKITMNLVGEREFQIDLNHLKKKVRKDVGTLTKGTGVKIADQSKKNLTVNRSVVTGTLRRSMTSEFHEAQCYSEAGTNVIYAPPVEFGHRQTPGRYVHAIRRRLKAARVAAKPFLTPAYKRYEPIYFRALMMLLKKAFPRG